MGSILFSLLIFSLSIISGSDAAWCVCRSDVSNVSQQKALDYACGAGADCGPISQNGACFNPNTVLAHCSYAANSYYQRKGQAQGTCDFAGTATPTATDPSGNGCTYPATPSAAGTSTSTPTPSTTTPPTTTTPPPPATTTTPPASMTPPSTTDPGLAPPSITTPGLAPPSTTTTPGMTPPSTFSPTTGSGGVLGGIGPTGTGISSTDTSDGGLEGVGMGSLLLTTLFSCMVLLRG